METSRANINTKTFKFILVVAAYILVVISTIIIISPKAEALPGDNFYPRKPGDGATQNAIASKTGNWYPGQHASGPNKGKWYNDGNDAYNCAWGSHWNENGSIPNQDNGACSTGLPAGITRYKVFQNASGGGPQGIHVYLNGACKGDTANGTTPYKKQDNPNKGDRRLKVTANQTMGNGNKGDEKSSTNNYNQGDCVGDDLRVTVPASAFTLNQQAKYGSGVYTALVVVEKLDPKGQQMFRLSAPGGVKIFGDEDASFASGNRREGSFSNYEFIITTDCGYRQNQDYSFNLHDIDWGGLQRPNNPIRIILVPMPFASSPENIVGELIAPSPGGNTGTYKLPPGTLKESTSYRLTFSNIEDNNGIRFDLPFSEYPSPPNCPEPPGPPPTSACDLLEFNMAVPPGSANNNIPGTSVDPPRRHFAVYVNDGSSAGVPGPINNPSGAGYQVQPGGIPNTYNTNTYNWTTPLKGPVDYNSRDSHLFPDGIEENRNIRINLKNGRIGILDGNTEISHRDTNTPALKSGPLEWTVVIYNVYQKPNDPRAGENRIHVWYRETFNAGNTPALANCYQASCSVNIIENVTGNNGNDNAVQAGSQFTAIMRVHNNSSHRLPIRLGSAPLGLTNGGGNWNIGTSYNNPVWHGLDPDWMVNGIPQGQSATATVYLNAQGHVGTQQLVPYPDYYGALGVGGTCPTNVHVYRPFAVRLNPGVDLLRDGAPNTEDPNLVNFRFNPGFTTNPDVGVNLPYNMQSKRNGALLNNQNGVVGLPASGPVVWPYPNPPAVVAGDIFRVDVNTGRISGWVGPGGPDNILGAVAGSDFAENVIYDRPYISVYGADAIAGSNFKNGNLECPAIPAGETPAISAFRSPVGGKSGSGAQFAAMAIGQISGFSSSRLRDPLSSNPFNNDKRRLAFSNLSGFINNTAETPNDGGFLSNRNLCATDFWNNIGDDPVVSNVSSLNLATITDGKETLVTPAGGKLTLTNSGYSKNATLYVDGDVVINTNQIAYNPPNNFKLIVKGNIYIRNTVNRLDGLYVAQPKDDNTGHIYTCTNLAGQPFQASGTNELYNNCRSQLVVNGAFVAKSVKLLRTAYSLRDSLLTERPAFATGTGTRAAEIFNFSPEIFIYGAGDDEDSGSTDPYYYLTTLPPTL